MTGWNSYKKKTWFYPDIKSAIRPVPNCSEVLVPVFSSLPDSSPDDTVLETMEERDNDCSNFSDSMPDTPKAKPFTKGELNDLVRDLALSKEAAEILASRLSEHFVLDSEARITFFRKRDEILIHYFSEEENFVYCNNIKGLLLAMGLPHYNPYEWRLFIDSSKRSLKCVLLHNGNKFACVPIGHSVILKEHYSSVKMVLEKMCYKEHNWVICVDLKMVNFLLGQ